MFFADYPDPLGAGRQVVIKRLLSQLGTNPEYLKVFLDEVRLVLRALEREPERSFHSAREMQLALGSVDESSFREGERDRGAGPEIPPRRRRIPSGTPPTGVLRKHPVPAPLPMPSPMPTPTPMPMPVPAMVRPAAVWSRATPTRNFRSPLVVAAIGAAILTGGFVLGLTHFIPNASLERHRNPAFENPVPGAMTAARPPGTATTTLESQSRQPPLVMPLGAAPPLSPLPPPPSLQGSIEVVQLKGPPAVTAASPQPAPRPIGAKRRSSRNRHSGAR